MIFSRDLRSILRFEKAHTKRAISESAYLQYSLSISTCLDLHAQVDNYKQLLTVRDSEYEYDWQEKLFK
jgi:hypothetical protein